MTGCVWLRPRNLAMTRLHLCDGVHFCAAVSAVRASSGDAASRGTHEQGGSSQTQQRPSCIELLPYTPLVWQPPLEVDDAMVAACRSRARDYSDSRHTKFYHASAERAGRRLGERIEVHEVSTAEYPCFLAALPSWIPLSDS